MLCGWWTQVGAALRPSRIFKATLPSLQRMFGCCLGRLDGYGNLLHWLPLPRSAAGKLKERRYDASRGMSLLVEDWVSAASGEGC